MSEPTPAPPKWRTGWLWGILAAFLIVGTVGAAMAVFGALVLVGGGLLGAVYLLSGAVVATLAFLFTLGILYRVDRYRGAAQRRVELFD